MHFKRRGGAHIRWGQPLTRGLVAAFPCNEGQGTYLNDVSGHGFSAPIGAVVQSPSWRDDGLVLNNNYIICPVGREGVDGLSYGRVDKLTATLRIKPLWNTEYLGSLISNCFDAGPTWTLRIKADDTYALLVYLDGWAIATSTKTYVKNEWVTLTARVNRPIADLFMNGVLEATATKDGPMYRDLARGLCIGRESTAGSSWGQFVLDYAYVWARALTNDEIKLVHEDPYSILR